MKRNMVPLLGIAFVVAIISTGVFYGLFAGKLRSSSDLPGHAIVVAARDLDRGTVLQASDLRVSEVLGVLGGSFSKPEEAEGATLLTAMKANEPLLEERLSARLSKTAATGGPVPSGMRAVSLHVFQSESLLNLLAPGSRVDVQAVSDRNGTVELRMVLENVQVLAVSAADSNGNRPPGAVVTVLTQAANSDMLALADAGARIRMTLRNPVDQGTTARHSLVLAALFSGSNKLGADIPEATASAWDHPVQLHVRVLSASDRAMEELRAGTSEINSDAAWRLSAFHSRDEASKLIHGLEQKHELEIVSGERLMAGVGRPISYHAGPQPYQLRVRFSPQWLNSGKLNLRVKPILGVQANTAVSSEPETQLPDTSSFLLESQANDPAAQEIIARIFPGRSWEHQHLVIFVSTRTIQQTSPVAVARTDRGR